MERVDRRGLMTFRAVVGDTNESNARANGRGEELTDREMRSASARKKILRVQHYTDPKGLRNLKAVNVGVRCEGAGSCASNRIKKP